MSDDLLATARSLLSAQPASRTTASAIATAAAAHAAVDTAETARAMHTTLEGILQAVDALVCDKAPAHAPTGTAAGDPSPPPAAADTPQVGEVWERKRGALVRATVAAFDDGAYLMDSEGARQLAWIPVESMRAEWRRVSPAPAPLTEREVTAEAEAQGVEPASDREVAGWAQKTHRDVWRVEDWEHVVDSLIARVRAEEARAENAERALEMSCADTKSAQARADAAEAQVALMAPVVEAAEVYTNPRPFSDGEAMRRMALREAVRAYREATRDA